MRELVKLIIRTIYIWEIHIFKKLKGIKKRKTILNLNDFIQKGEKTKVKVLGKNQSWMEHFTQ